MKHRQWIGEQRECYSDKSISAVEAALSRLIADVDRLCNKSDRDRFFGRLLREIDSVTMLSAKSDLKKHH